MRVAVIGAGGHVGSAILAQLARQDALTPVAVVRNGLVARVLSPGRAEVRVGAVSDPGDAEHLLSDCDGIVNCALPRGTDAMPTNKAIMSNIARLKARVVVHFSSVAVYGARIACDASNTRLRPDGSYGRSKLALERFAKRIFATSGRRYYVLRLGHVYGAGQWVSREIIENLRTGGFGLPFDGRSASNTVWIGEVALAVNRLLVDGPASGTYDLPDAPNRSWRELYDLHAATLDLPRARSLSDETSARVVAGLRSDMKPAHVIRHSVTRALQSAGASFVHGAVELRQAIDPVLSKLPTGVEERLLRLYLRWRVQADIARLPPAEPLPPFWMFSAAVPGPFLMVPESVKAAAREEFAPSLRSWYEQAYPSVAL